MASIPVYNVTPCCPELGMKQVFQITTGSPEDGTYIYEGAPVTVNGISFQTGYCYTIELIGSNGSFTTPDLPNFADFNTRPLKEACDNVECEPCTVTSISYQFQSCCGGNPIYYNIDAPNSIVSGTTYAVIIFNEAEPDVVDKLECYTITELSTYNPAFPNLPVESIFGQLECGPGTTCETLCLPCTCVRFRYLPAIPDPAGVVIIDCNVLPAVYEVPANGEWSDPVCLRFYQLPSVNYEVQNLGECKVSLGEEGLISECPTKYKLINCSNAEEVVYVSNNLSSEFAQNLIIRWENKCWYIEEAEQYDELINIIYTETYSDCRICGEKDITNYELINCDDPTTIIYTSTNLSAYLGKIVSLNEYPDDCWFVRVLNIAIPTDTSVTVNLTFDTCQDCGAQQYLLEDCDIDNPDPNIITNVDLSAYVGQVVTLNNCPDKCWIVSEIDSIETPQFVHVVDNYTTCELCIQPPPPPVPEPLPPFKSITPGYNTPGCEADKYERIVCNFSESMYRQVMVDAYGITPCCGEDDIQYEIRYELIKLKAIEDPDYKCGKLDNCDCTTSTAGLSQQDCSTPN